MVIIALSSWPTESAKAISERFTGMPAVPDFIKMEGPYMYPNGGEGIQATTLYKFEKAKMPEAVKLANDQHAVFWGVPGFRYDVKVCTGAKYAVELSGGVKGPQ